MHSDAPGRTINRAARTDYDEMTNEMCTDFCFEHGFAYAGTEYYYECYCGNKLATGGIETTESDCNTPCRGDSEQPCGGPDRLTLYRRTSTGPQENPGVKDWPHIGCHA